MTNCCNVAGSKPPITVLSVVSRLGCLGRAGSASVMSDSNHFTIAARSTPANAAALLSSADTTFAGDLDLAKDGKLGESVVEVR